MQLSARNTLKGTVKKIDLGTVNAVITLEIAPGVVISGMITKESAERLSLAEGKEAYAVIKASDVMFGID
jgi:molybdopterin-binding protein